MQTQWYFLLHLAFTKEIFEQFYINICNFERKSILKLNYPEIYRRDEKEKEEKEIRRFLDRRYENYFTALSTMRSSLHGSEAQKRCLHSGSSSCDRYHAGERNIVIRPIAEIDNRSTARPHTCPKGANACPQHRSSLACLLPFLIRRIKCNLLDNVRRVHLSYRGNRLQRARTNRNGNVDVEKRDIRRKGRDDAGRRCGNESWSQLYSSRIRSNRMFWLRKCYRSKVDSESESSLIGLFLFRSLP